MISGSSLGSTTATASRQGFAQIVMVSDNKVHAAGFGVVHGFVGGDASVAGQDQFCAAVDDLGQFGDVDAVRRNGADGNVIGHVRAEGCQRLHQQGGGCLPVHVEVAPDADRLLIADSQKDALDGRLHAGKFVGGAFGEQLGRGRPALFQRW